MKRRMRFSSRSWLQLALVGFAMSGCAPLGDTVELGVYQRENRQDAASDALDAGTPNDVPDAASATPPGEGDAVAPVKEPQPPCATHGCISSVPVADDEPGVQCQHFVAHDVTDADAAYLVPDGGEHYARFTLKAPDQAIFYLRSIKALIGDGRVLHHMRLYESHGELPEGLTFGAAVPASLRLLYSWAPGSKPLYFDRGVGLELGANTHYTLEVHYVTGNGVYSARDASGFELCTTSAAPEYRVSVTRIGPMPVLGSSASATCKPTVPAPVQLLAVYPQIDPRARHATLSTQGWSPSDAVLYDTEVDYELGEIQPLANVQMTPGGSLQASCVYNLAGTVTPDEQCSLYVLHWPAHTLSILNGTVRPDVCP